MFSKVVALYFLTFFDILAAAAPGGGDGNQNTPTYTMPTPTVTVTVTPTATSISQCNTGGAQCCNTVESASSPGLGLVLGLLGVILQDVTALVGLGCTPVTILDLGQGANCAQQPVCCQNNNFNGIINIGCTPISL